MIKKNLIKGKWYHLPHTNNYYCKYDRNDLCSEYITDNYKYSSSGGPANWNNCIEADMNIVCQYLPKNHPDKLFNNELFITIL
jgi:hypothetical protein